MPVSLAQLSYIERRCSLPSTTAHDLGGYIAIVKQSQFVQHEKQIEEGIDALLLKLEHMLAVKLAELPIERPLPCIDHCTPPNYLAVDINIPSPERLAA